MGKSRAFVAVVAGAISLAWLVPAQAQFWDWGNRPQRQQQYNNNWFGGGGGWFGSPGFLPSGPSSPGFFSPGLSSPGLSSGLSGISFLGSSFGP